MLHPHKTNYDPSENHYRFKKSGEFDRLRRDLLAQFQNGVSAAASAGVLTPEAVNCVNCVFLKKAGTEAFWARVDDIARARLEAEDKLHLKADETLHRELLQELDRYEIDT